MKKELKKAKKEAKKSKRDQESESEEDDEEDGDDGTTQKRQKLDGGTPPSLEAAERSAKAAAAMALWGQGVDSYTPDALTSSISLYDSEPSMIHLIHSPHSQVRRKARRRLHN